MGSLRLVTLVLPTIAVLLGSPAFAQSPTYGVGRTPTAEEIRRMDISIGATGEELPAGRGTAKEGAQVYEQKACVACHGAAGLGGWRLRCNQNQAKMFPSGNGSASYHCARHLRRRCGISSIAACLSGMRGTLTADEVYALTAYLLFLNKVIPEDQVLDKQSLPKVKMPIGDGYAKLHEWKPKTPRLEGYPF